MEYGVWSMEYGVKSELLKLEQLLTPDSRLPTLLTAYQKTLQVYL